jgi:HPt (histidine-containing phosphotransfer) domain-containing protein
MDLRVDPGVAGQSARADPIDQHVIASLRELGPDDFHELIRLFLDEAGARVTRLRAVDAREDVAGVAHALRGTGAAFGATKLSALCAEVEHAATQQTTDLRALTEAIAAEFDRVREALAKELK